MLNSRRRWLKRVGALAALTSGGLSGLIRDALANGNAPVSPGIHKLTGEVRVNGKPAQAGMLVHEGDTVSTGKGAEVIYVIGKDAYLQRESTAVNFASEATKQVLRIITGKILSVFGKGTPRSIKVSTATIGIRGTGCYIEDEPAPVDAGRTASGKSRTYFCLCYGSVELEPSAAPAERVSYSTSHHDHPLFIHDDMTMPTMMVPAGVMNHTDAELTLLEALVGRRPPFFGQDGKY